MNRGSTSSRPGVPFRQRKMPSWVALLLIGAVLLLLYPAMLDVRYGAGWAVAWELAQCTWLPLFFVEPAQLAPWLRRHVSWAFAYFTLMTAIPFFGFIVLLFGLWLRPWWCLVIGLGAAVLVIAGVWPAQLRFYKMQQTVTDREHSRTLVLESPGRRKFPWRWIRPSRATNRR